MIDQALEYLTYAEVQATPLAALRQLIEARTRRRFRERGENLRDDTMSKEINYGQAVKGQLPPSKQTYKIVDTPYQRHQNALDRAGLGLPPTELPDERAARLKAENAAALKAMLG